MENPIHKSLPVAPIKGRSIVWENGLPVPCDVEPVTPQALKGLHFAALSLQYDGYYDELLEQWVIEDRFIGLTNAEVMIRRQVEKATAGDSRALESVLDRTMGKPKQTVESTTMTMTYQDFLQQLVDEDTNSQPSSQDPNVVDAEFEIFNTPNPDDDILAGL